MTVRRTLPTAAPYQESQRHIQRSALHRSQRPLPHHPQRSRAFTNARNAERSDAKPKRGPQGELVTPAPQRAWNPPPMAAIKSGDMRVGFDSLRLCKCRQRRRAVKGRAVAQPQAVSAEPPPRQKSADFWRNSAQSKAEPLHSCRLCQRNPLAKNPQIFGEARRRLTLASAYASDSGR